MRRLFTLIYILIVTQSAFAQVNSIEELTKKYTSFEYRDVVQLANNMIESNEYSSNELVQIYELKGMALYSLGDESNSRIALENLLKIDPTYSMDPNRISPKIISFFNEIKVTRQNELDQERPILDSLRIIKQEMAISQNNYRTAIVKNLVFPGWGHFDMGNLTKGVIYSILQASSLASSIAYILKTNDARSAYQNETDKALIQTKYDEYNSAYKTRNLLLFLTAAVWAASQIDLLIFTDINHNGINEGVTSQFSPPKDYQFSVSIPLN